MGVRDWSAGVVRKTPIESSGNYTSSSASGVWSLDSVCRYKAENKWPIPGNVSGDPYFSYVTLLLKADDANGTTSPYDSSNNHRAVTSQGGAAVSTTNSKFGTGSLQFNGYQRFDTTSTVFNGLSGLSNNFTVEFWIYLIGVAGDIGDVLNMDQSGDIGGAMFYVVADGSFGFSTAGSGSYTGVGAPAGSFALNTWQHLAYCKSGSTLRLFANGVQKASVTVTSANLPSYSYTMIGGRIPISGDVRGINGYLDELRVTNGIARYTTDFSAPSDPFPAFGT